ncbi:MAG TPA: hypothetical protein VK494_03295 [Gemmatimonadaceae bacterium]|nr:hypothetical protein [Gemmatimonadaceae bacterium]
MKKLRLMPMMILPLTLGALLTSADAQGKAKGQGTDKPKAGQGAGKSAKKGPAAPASPVAGTAVKQSGPPQNRGQARAAEIRAEGGALAPNRGRAISRFARDLRVSEVRPAARGLLNSNRPAEFITGGALAYALARGAPENALLITPGTRDVAIRNRRGDLLLTLDDDRARSLGVWQVNPVTDRVTNGAPSFCRSGEGHPVWGRQWCLDKGFGVGAQQDVRWGATPSVSDIIFGRRPGTPTLTRDALASILGPVAFDRLALHALTLGYTDPLTGVWRSEATGPDVLLVKSGRHPVAELVDRNRDQRPELMLVALRPW